MEELNYEQVGKKATIECLLSGEIDVNELSDFYLIDIENVEAYVLRDICTDELIKSINNPNILFLQKSK